VEELNNSQNSGDEEKYEDSVRSLNDQKNPPDDKNNNKVATF
jgi:hypothetical protein